MEIQEIKKLQRDIRYLEEWKKEYESKLRQGLKTFKFMAIIKKGEYTSKEVNKLESKVVFSDAPFSSWDKVYSKKLHFLIKYIIESGGKIRILYVDGEQGYSFIEEDMLLVQELVHKYFYKINTSKKIQELIETMDLTNLKLAEQLIKI